MIQIGRIAAYNDLLFICSINYNAIFIYIPEVFITDAIFVPKYPELIKSAANQHRILLYNSLRL